MTTYHVENGKVNYTTTDNLPYGAIVQDCDSWEEAVASARRATEVIGFQHVATERDGEENSSARPLVRWQA